MDLLHVALLAMGAALAAPVGGLAAIGVHRRVGEVGQTWIRSLVAFGGGLLLAAVALVLVPQGMARLSVVMMAVWLLAGAVLFMGLDKFIERRGGRASQVMADALDSIPESLGMGAAFAAGGGLGIVLALLIGLQNLPQGFTGFLEMRRSTVRAPRVLAIMFATSLFGPLAAVLGYLYLGPHPTVIAAIFLAASGGILYLLVQDIAPLAHKDGHWVPALGAVVGFVVGLVSVEVFR